MSVKITYSNKTNKFSINTVLFTNDKFKIDNLKNHISKSEFFYIKDLMKNSDLKKKYVCL